MSSENQQVFGAVLLGSLFVGTMLIANNQLANRENFGNMVSTSGSGSGVNPIAPYPAYPLNKQMYSNESRQRALMNASQAPRSNVQSNNIYAGPDGGVPMSQNNINLNTSGDQLLSYQLYQQGANAATPTLQQLQSISGESQQQTGSGLGTLDGGVSSQFAPYNVLPGTGPELYDSEYQAVNIGNPRAESISACAQNAPTFVATSLLPKPTVPGQDSWNISAPQNILANQNFLSSTEQLGVDTVLSSLRNPSHDIRSTIANPINIVSPWMNTTINPDLERRPLDCFIPSEGIYSCGPTGCNANGTYIGQ